MVKFASNGFGLVIKGLSREIVMVIRTVNIYNVKRLKEGL